MPPKSAPSGTGKELGNFVNSGTPNVISEYPAERFGPRRKAPLLFSPKNHLAFSIFILFFITVFIFLITLFFPLFWAGVNAYILGVFKRPLPAKPELYFDVNCINSMNLGDFLEPNQVQRCREMRPIDRPGPPRRFR